MRQTDTPHWFVPSSELNDAPRSFAGRIVINPRQLSGASQTLKSVAGEVNFSVPAPPKLPPGGEALSARLAALETQSRQIAHELRAMASVLVQRAQYAQAGQAISGDAPTLDIATKEVREEDTEAIRADMDKRNLSKADRAIIEGLLKNGLWHHQYVELLHGGHILVEGRQLYKDWQKLDGVYDRSGSNSHYRDPERFQRDGPRWGDHYGIDSNDLGGVLFGPGPDGSTFIQLEGHGMHTTDIVDIDMTWTGPRLGVDVGKAGESVGHMGDYNDYRSDPLHQNRGPHGTSIHNDSNPMVLGTVKVPKKK